MRISLIVAMAENGVIGRDGGMPWHLSEDLRYFKKMTLGKPVIMGRKTFASIGKALPGRPNIVITRDETFTADGVHVATSVNHALELARALCLAEKEVMVIGGGQIYAEALGHADQIYMTRIHQAVDGDTVFPPLQEDQWREVSCVPGRENFSGQPEISFVILEKLKS